MDARQFLDVFPALNEIGWHAGYAVGLCRDAAWALEKNKDGRNPLDSQLRSMLGEMQRALDDDRVTAINDTCLIRLKYLITRLLSSDGDFADVAFELDDESDNYFEVVRELARASLGPAIAEFFWQELAQLDCMFVRPDRFDERFPSLDCGALVDLVSQTVSLSLDRRRKTAPNQAPTSNYARSIGPVFWITVSEAARVAFINKGTISRAAERGEIRTNGQPDRDLRLDAASFVEWQLARLKRPERREQDETVRQRLRAVGDD